MNNTSCEPKCRRNKAEPRFRRTLREPNDNNLEAKVGSLSDLAADESQLFGGSLYGTVCTMSASKKKKCSLLVSHVKRCSMLKYYNHHHQEASSHSCVLAQETDGSSVMIHE